MTFLFNRLVQLRDEYFNELDLEDLVVIENNINEDYSSDELILVMRDYSDLFNKRGVEEC